MKLYAGFDLHSSNSHLGIIDEDGKRAFKKKLPSNRDAILSALAQLYKSTESCCDALPSLFQECSNLFPLFWDVNKQFLQIFRPSPKYIGSGYT